jgi:predicted RND superfamily exporter protein|tara:strand:- start:1628 stop:4792 length:3165 start_codon:yes stop_codon:yes gene_type:complete
MAEQDADKTPSISSNSDESKSPGSSQSTRLSRGLESGYNRIQNRAVDISARVKDFKTRDALDAVLDAPVRLRREWQEHGAIGAITRFPLATVILFLMITLFFVSHSGFYDRYLTQFDDDTSETDLNVNGDLEVYLPDGSKVGELLSLIEEDWTSNVMVIYIELGGGRNITDQRILQEISFIENQLNPCISSFNCTVNGMPENDSVVYILSLSTVLKEVNSSAPRVREAFITELGQLGCGLGQDECLTAQAAEELNDALALTDEQFGGGYEIPSQRTINAVINEMYEDDGTPTPGLDKLARDIKGDETSQNQESKDTPDGTLDRAIMAVAVSDDVSAKEIIRSTEENISRISNLERPCLFNADGSPDSNAGLCVWNEKVMTDEQRERYESDQSSLGVINLEMTLTGPVPITNAVTDRTFDMFWDIFPMAVVLVAIGLFVFHCDILQTGLTGFRPLQGLKVVIIAGLPTLCAVFCTLGIIGWSNFEVTMTVIIVGPILLALGVSYGLHITNRYAEEGGTKAEKMRGALSSTGKAVFLSAVTTIIGFVSLVFTPMAPIQTVGIALSGGIVVVYILTMFMVPNLTLLLDLRKPKHPPLKPFELLVEIPVKYNKGVIGVFLLLILVSATYGQANVEENIDMLKMAPNDEPSVETMDLYSKEFNSGQLGMVLVQANLTGDTSIEVSQQDPAENLRQIETLEGLINDIDDTTAVSIVFLMKSSGIAPTIECDGCSEFVQSMTFLPEDVRDTASILLDTSVTQDASFWDLLTSPDAYGLPASRQSEVFLLNVFYSSITDETREIFISEDFDRSLILVDMPYLPVSITSSNVDTINDHTSTFTGTEPGNYATELTGVASTTIEVNTLIVGSQWTSLGFAVILTLITLAIVFKDIRYSIWTTSPVIATVALQWLVMWRMDVDLSLVTVMIGSILVGVGVDFSIHISNRIRELGGGIEAIRSAAIGTGMSLLEAAVVTSLGMFTAYQIPIEAISPFITVILILLWVAAASALILLPAIFVTLEKSGIGAVGGRNSMSKRLGLGKQKALDIDVLDAALSDEVHDAW